MKGYYRIVFYMIFVNICFSAIDLDFNFAMTVEQKVQLILAKAEDLSKNKGNHDLALKMCNEAIKMQSGYLEPYYRRAFVFGRKGDYVNAVKDFSIVIKNDEKNEKMKYPAARKFRADCFMGLGYMQKAVDDYSVMLKRDSKSNGSGKIWYYYAEALALMNKTELAVNAIQQGCSTGSHWCEKMRILQKKILIGEEIKPHKPFSN
ncbi:MAG: hypothetical protein A2097_11975 [Desulfobacula sp. GWF2_41_7]|nr:MAG: hypothetical protein A2097_11975 [Desulfobacula sp. GWF2_41_7]